MNLESSKLIPNIAIGILIFIGFSVLLCRSYDPFYTTGLIFATLLSATIFFRRHINISLLDILVIVLWFYEVFSHLFISINPIQSFSYLSLFTVSVCYYFLLRFYFTDKNKAKVLLLSYSILLCFLSLVALVSFILFKNAIDAAEFSGLYDYRFVYHPYGFLTNVWGSLLLGFLGLMILCLYLYRNSTKISVWIGLMILPVIFGIIVSFSRGVYLSFGLFILLIAGRFWGARINVLKKVSISILVTTTMIFMAIPFHKEITRTFNIAETLSQQRSIEGRISAGKIAWKIFSQSPLCGTGSGNYSLAANPYIYENDHNSFAHFASSVAFQIISEKGVIGTIIWLSIVVTIFIMFIRTRKNTLVFIAFTVLLVIILRELTHPVFYEFSGLQLIAFTLLAMLQNEISTLKHPQKTKISKCFCVIPILISMALSGKSIINYYDQNNNAKFLELMDQSRYLQAEQYINKTSESVPYLINRAVLYWKLFERTKDMEYLEKSQRNLIRVIDKNPFDFQQQHNMAIVCNTMGRTDVAENILHELNRKFPENSTYKLGMFSLLSDKKLNRTAANYAIEAVILSPGVMDTHFWKHISQKDSNIIRELDKAIQDSLKSNTINPIMLAKYGKILLSLGKTTLSECMIKNALTQLPNLSRPWCYLGQIEFRNGNQQQAMKYMTKAKTLAPYDKLPDYYISKYTNDFKYGSYNFNDVFFMKYEVKFWRWYHTQTIRFEYL